MKSSRTANNNIFISKLQKQIEHILANKVKISCAFSLKDLLLVGLFRGGSPKLKVIIPEEEQKEIIY